MPVTAGTKTISGTLAAFPLRANTPLTLQLNLKKEALHRLHYPAGEAVELPRDARDSCNWLDQIGIWQAQRLKHYNDYLPLLEQTLFVALLDQGGGVGRRGGQAGTPW